MKLRHLITIVTLASSASVNASSHAQSTIVETATDAGVFNTLIAAAQAAGVAEWIDNSVPKTVFAPTDDAFAALPEGVVDSLLLPENKNMLTNILQYHIVYGKVTSDRLVDGIVQTTSSAGIKVSTSNGVVINDTAMVVSADIEAKNGIIHVIDAVLLPPENNIVGVVVNDPDLSTLTAALSAAGLVDVLQGGGPYTVLAPTNAAFAALPEGTVESLLLPENLETLQNILLYHVLGQSVYSGDLQNGPISAANGGTITVNLAGPVFGFPSGGANPAMVDMLGKNGVVHKIDTVLLPGSDNLVEKLSADGRFTTLLTAAGAADLATVLSEIKGVTLFAPTDEAFGRLPAGTLQQLLLPENKELLANVLLYHVVTGNWYANSLSTHAYSTAAGAELLITVGSEGVDAGGNSKVVEADIVAGTGVIHAVDNVILPPLNMADTLGAMPKYSTLVAALKAAGLFDVLNASGPFTLFAPSNEAFAALPAGTVESLLLPENKSTLQEILLSHVVAEKTMGGALLKGAVTSMQGKVLNVHWVHDALLIGSEATILKTDMPVWNGVIHSIDAVLIP